ncbi:MAG TPA: M12 family metallo-peptidase, partial [Thermoanaerobaculia bacterium]|nr:M12 family metallo-peptidase [Thermoanaerobaculia bacterium]
MRAKLLPALALVTLASLTLSVPLAAEEHQLFTYPAAPPAGPAAKSGTSANPAEPALLSDHRVEIDLAALATTATTASNPRLSLPDGATYELRGLGHERRGPGDETWRAKLAKEGEAGAPEGQLVLTSRGGRTAATILSPSGVFRIEPLAAGGHHMEEIDEGRLPGCGGAVSPPFSGGGGGRQALAGRASTEDFSIVDILVVYTSNVRIKLGSAENVLAVIQNDIDVANTTYANSQISANLRLVGTQEITLDEDGQAENELTAFHNRTDIPALRKKVGADVVSLLVERMDDACGIGYLMNKDALGPDFSPYAFSVVRRFCAPYVLVHEVGHNMGCEHDPGNSSDTPDQASYPYSYGYFVDGNFRTVMAYANRCTKDCLPTLYFSNPDVSYNGLPTGIAGDRDNHRTINNTRALVASFMAGTPPQPCRPGPHTLCLLNRRFQVDVSWENQYDGSSGVGAAIARTDLTGFFSFGDPSNVELMVKVLDFGDAIKVFYGQLTDLHFSLNVTDTRTGMSKTYSNTSGNCGAIDQSAFAASTASTASTAGSLGAAGRAAFDPLFGRAAASGTCRPSAGTLCLGNGRFAVNVSWANAGNGTQGQGGAVPLSSLTGAFYFTDASNLELLTKILDFGDRIAFFYGTLSDLEYTLSVVDTVNGTTRSYHNP